MGAHENSVAKTRFEMARNQNWCKVIGVSNGKTFSFTNSQNPFTKTTKYVPKMLSIESITFTEIVIVEKSRFHC